MSRSSYVSPEIDQYVEALFAPEDEVLREAKERAERLGIPAINIGPVEGRILELLIRLINARNVLEIGTLFGYSGLWMARALPANGRLICLEAEAKHAAAARETFQRGGVEMLVEVREGHALDLLAELQTEAPFDFVFIDAEKEEYPAYLEWALKLVRPGGVICGDNTLGHGDIHRDPATIADEALRKRIRALQEFNRRFAQDPRLCSHVLPTYDGLTIGVVLS